MRANAQAAGKKKDYFSAVTAGRGVQLVPRADKSARVGSIPTVSTIVEPVEPKGLAGFSLCSTACRDVCGIDDMSVSDRYSSPKRQTEIPTDLL